MAHGYCIGDRAMLDQNNLLQNDELYYQCGKIVNDNIVTIQKEVSSLRRYFADRRKDFNENTRHVEDGSGDGTWKDTHKFYERVLRELAKVELICDEYRLGLKIDLLREAKARLELPSNLSKLPNAGTCKRRKEDFSDLDRLDGNCVCKWKPIPGWLLDDTRDIIVKPKSELPSAFDDSDLKFKQEMTLLRSKLFSLPRNEIRMYNDDLMKKTGNGKKQLHLSPTQESLDIYWSSAKYEQSTIESELQKMSDLKFLDGVFLENITWAKILDMRGNQFRTKWQLVLQRQIERLTLKRRIPKIHLDASKTFELLSTIPENGFNFQLYKEILVPLVKNKIQTLYLKNWKLQFRTTKGLNIAATLIQAYWRGYSLRKRIWETERLYIAASVLWYAWMVVQEKRRMHQKYLKKMLESMQAIKEASLVLSVNFSTIIRSPHVIIHLASLGYPTETRRHIDKKQFCMDENACSLRISFVRNPMTHVIYVLPVKPTNDLLEMYSDLIESVSPEEDFAKRITFVALSEAATFKNRTLNLSRILHCSEQSLQEIRKKIADKRAYFLPWIVDECDVRLAGNLGVALLSPTIELQQRMLNPSRLTEMIESFQLPQPVHRRDIRDYEKLCNSLAELILRNTEIMAWQIRLNCGPEYNHCAVFYINHISIPFMPILRREREAYGEKWDRNPKLRDTHFLNLKEQLSNVVATVTTLPAYYNSWKQFYSHICKFGCLLQAVPYHKKSSVVSVGLFFPGKESGNEPRWTGTADELNLAKETFSSYAYMVPQTSVDTKKLVPVVNKFAVALHQEGYLGYLTLNCYCYPHKYEDKLLVLILDVHPCYSLIQSYIDWLKFSIDGDYLSSSNTFTGKIIGAQRKRRNDATFLLIVKERQWDETPLRYAIFIPKVHHTRFSSYSWAELRRIMEKTEVVYDSKKKVGTQLFLHDSEIRELAMMVNVGCTMQATIQSVIENLRKLYQALMQQKMRTNLPEIVDFFLKLSFTYVDASSDPCA